MSLVDIRTILFVYVISNATCAFVIAFLYLQNRGRFSGLGFWLADFVMQFAGLLLVALRGVVPDLVSMVVGNTLVIGGTILLFVGLERFVGKRGPQTHNWTLLALFMVIQTYFGLVQPSLQARNINISLSLAIACTQCAWLLLRRVEAEARPTTRDVGMVFVVFSLLNVVRVAWELAVPPGSDFLVSGTFEALFLLSQQMLFIVLTFALSLMVNRRLLAQVQAEEAKFSTLFRSAPYAITLTRPADGYILDVNDGFVKLSGYSAAEAIGKTMGELHMWASEEDRAAVVAELSKTGRVRDAESRFRKRSGEMVTGLFSIEWVTINGQRCMLSSMSDITKRKRAEEHVRRLNRVYAVLSEINQAVVRVREPQALFEKACRVAVEEGDFPFVWVGLVEDSTRRIRPVASAGKSDGYLEKIDVSLGNEPPGYCPIDCALREGQHVVCNAIGRGEDPAPCQEIALGLGYRSTASFHLRAADRIRGTITFYADEPDFFDEEELKLLDELAADLSFAMEAMEREEQRLRAERALSETLRTLETLVESAPVAILILDCDGRLMEWNRAATRLFGWAREEVLGKVNPIIPPGHEEEFHRLRRRAISGESYSDHETRRRKRDGSLVDVSVSVAPLRDSQGQVTGVVSVLVDTAERRQMEEMLARGRQLETVGKIAAQVAHDFNNLLVPMAAYPELIKMQLPEGHPAAPLCDTMLDSARAMAEINSDMMVLGRRGHTEQQPTDVNRVVRQAVEKLRDRPYTLVVEMDLAPDLLPAHGSDVQLLRVATNLLVNAREAMHDVGILRVKTENVYVDRPFGGHGRVDVGGYVRLVVADNGPGIPPEIRERVFEPFFTTKGRGKKPGSGLGLAIVQAIVEDHRGYVDLESEVGVGTSFFVYLPVSHEVLREADGEEEPRGGNEAILLVDDDQLLRDAGSRMLQALGYRVETVASGEEAVEHLQEQSADLLVLDMVMPGGIDGAETYRRVLEVRPGQKAIILSGFAESERVREAQALGAGEYVRKPVMLRTLARAVREELERR